MSNSGGFSISSAEVILESQARIDTIPANQQLHGAFLERIREHCPETSARLHDDDGRKPFTLSGLRRVAEAPQQLAFRVTALSHQVVDAVVTAFQPDPRESFRIRGRSMRVLEVRNSDPQWGAATTYDALVARHATPPPVSGRYLGFEFVSPTAFKASDSRDRAASLFPLPALLFGSIASAFRTHATWANAAVGATVLEQLNETEAAIEDTIEVSGYSLASGAVRFSNYVKVGFVGRIEYGFCRDAPPAHVAMLRTLAEFAFFAGVGIKTTMGMGQCIAYLVPRRSGSDQ